MIVVGVGLKSELLTDIKDRLVEMEELVLASGGNVVASLVQVLPQFNPATLIGTGKIQEIKELAAELGASVVAFDHPLSGIQGRNLHQIISGLTENDPIPKDSIRILDRNQIILDIFAQRARSYEGKLQVELAQMLDQLPRMVGAWLGSLSRQGGGIGTRGPGEKAIEMDRRRIRERMKNIRKELEGVSRHRQQHRTLRKRQRIPTFALVGYTNSGKSTLLNRLTKSSVLAKDQVFATLDPTTRKVFLRQASDVSLNSTEPITEALLTDTVGFIRNLPPHLIDAFKSTLEESSSADVLLHVIDLSHPRMDQQIQVVQQLIEELGWNKPILHVFNKMDIASPDKQFLVKSFPRVFISAETGQGLDQLKQMMIESVSVFAKEVELFFPKAEEHLIYELDRETKIERRETASQGTICKVSLTDQQLSKWKNYLS